MTGKDLLWAMSHIDRKYVQEAEFTPLRKERSVMKWVLLAAGAVAALAAVVVCVMRFGS